jgi:hypothetical protein
LSISLPFGTKSVESFAEAEHYIVVDGYNQTSPLSQNAQKCTQGLQNDETWYCEPVAASHVVCGHFGVFKFGYPNYVVNENTNTIRLSVSRSGGGYGKVSVSYYIKHFSTNDSDVSATALYTTSQTLVFDENVVERSFLISIQDDNVVEEDEVFQVVLEVPDGGGSVGPQFRTNVTIIDNDADIFSSSLSYPVKNNTYVPAGNPFNLTFQATDARNTDMNLGGELILAIIENNMKKWYEPGTPSNSQRHSLRKQLNVSDYGNGRYIIRGDQISEQGKYEMRAWHAFPGGLKGQYYYDGYFDKLALERIDRIVNFTWGYGKIAPHSMDYVTIRWTGALMVNETNDFYFKVEADDHARLWLDGILLLDHWQEMYAKLEPARKIFLEEGTLYELVLEYRDVRGEAHARLLYGTSDPPTDVVPSTNLYALYELSAMSPTDLNILSAETDPSKTECTGSGLFTATSDEKSEFLVCPRDRYGNLRDDDDGIYLESEVFKAVLSLDNAGAYDGVGAEEIVPSLTYDHDIHCFLGAYVPLQAGDYTLNITYQTTTASDAAQYMVAGAPFQVEVAPHIAFGPYSVIQGIETPTQTVEAGDCFNFTISTKDKSRNYLLAGGDDYSAYSYQVDWYYNTAEFPGNYSVHNHTHAYVRYGTVYDKEDGDYTVEFCPVLQGVHELHVLLNGKGVSNQPHRVMDTANSRFYSTAMGTHMGQYVDSSPYRLSVTHSSANAFTTTAEGLGLEGAMVNIPAYVLVTVRDSWDNVLRTDNYTDTTYVNCTLDRTPEANISVLNYHNGSYMVRYTPVASGMNSVSIKVNGVHIKNSPFMVTFEDGRPSEYSTASGDGLTLAYTGTSTYFQVFAYDVRNNRRSTGGDIYQFTLHGANNYTGYLVPCPKPPAAETGEDHHAICDPYDVEEGHYYGVYTPAYTGITVLSVYVLNSTHATDDAVIFQHITGSPWLPTVLPNTQDPYTSDIDGDIYDTIAGKTQTIQIQLRDVNSNKLISGDHSLELCMYGVSSEWGTIVPFGSTPGLPNAYHYKGFYSGDTNFYGDVVDNLDGTYVITHNATISGVYVSRYSMVIPGLNATYFNDTSFGHLYDDNHNPINDSRYTDTHGAQALNLHTSISWTGDIGGRPNEGNTSTLGGRGGLGYGAYYHMFKSRTEENIDFDLTSVEWYASNGSDVGYTLETRSPFTREEKFRESYWSARWHGLITPDYAETYYFDVDVDSFSTVRMYIGGRGVGVNGSLGDSSQVEVLSISLSLANQSEISTIRGEYTFTDTLPRDFVLEYVHYDGDSYMNVSWESASTMGSVIPSTAFSHWVNMSHYNTTVHPDILSPIHSTVVGEALTEGTVGTLHSFHLYARDRFGNLRQTGGEVPTMVAVGIEGAMFRGNVTDYGNSTYLVEYYATLAGSYLMYITVGCCAAHPNVGIAQEIHYMRDDALLVEGAPYPLIISPNVLYASKTVAIGEGVLGATAGIPQSFDIFFRDVHSNPTALTQDDVLSNTTFTIEFHHLGTGSVITQTSHVHSINYTYLEAGMHSTMVTYNLTIAGEYEMYIWYGDNVNGTAEPLLGSPYYTYVMPGKAYANNVICRGIGLHFAYTNVDWNFEVQLFDAFQNNLITGGDKLYVRLLGDSDFNGEMKNVPRCRDTLNGRYACTYQVNNTGYHELDIRVVNASIDQPGGLGLVASYYSAPVPMRNNMYSAESENTVAQLVALKAPTVVQIDSMVSKSWPSGYIIPVPSIDVARDGTTVNGTIPNGYGAVPGGSNEYMASGRHIGQAVVWQGFISPPRDDTFKFWLRLKSMSGSVYLDQELVYDSVEDIQTEIVLQASSVYEIRVEAAVTTTTKSTVAIDLMWSTPVVKWSKIPSFFLYDSAESVFLSPFAIEVESPTPFPTGTPTGQPTSQPTQQPSSQPSGVPSAQPSGQPSAQPSAEPSGQPSTQPSSEPTA